MGVGIFSISAVFLYFSRVVTVVVRGPKSLVFGVVFLGSYLNTKEWKIRAWNGRLPAFFRCVAFAGVLCSPLRRRRFRQSQTRRPAEISETTEMTEMTKTLAILGNGRNTVSRVLFRRRELTEPH